MTTITRIFGISLIVSGLTTASFAEDVNLRLGHVGAPVSPQESIAKLFADKVAEYSDGSVTLQIFNSGTLGNEKQLQEGVRSGTLDATIAGTFSNFVPWAGALESPMLYSSLDHFTAFYGSDEGRALMAAFQADAGVKALFVVPHGGFRYITMKDAEVRAPADLKGIKIRNPNVPSFNVMAEAVGAIPTPIDFAELYVALQRGVVQGQHNPVGNIVGARLYEVQDSLSMVPWGISPHMVSVSTAAWDKLDEAQQQAVTRAAGETAAEYPAIAVEEEEKLLAEMEGQIKIIRAEEVDLDAFLAVFRDTGLPALKAEYGEAAGKWLDAIDAAR